MYTKPVNRYILTHFLSFYLRPFLNIFYECLCCGIVRLQHLVYVLQPKNRFICPRRRYILLKYTFNNIQPCNNSSKRTAQICHNNNQNVRRNRLRKKPFTLKISLEILLTSSTFGFRIWASIKPANQPQASIGFSDEIGATTNAVITLNG